MYWGKSISRPQRGEVLQKVLRHYCADQGITYDSNNIGKISFPIAFGPYGKPYLSKVPGDAKIHFSISHSGHWWACGVDDSPLGIDIEDAGERETRNARSAGQAEQKRQAEELSLTEDQRWKEKNAWRRIASRFFAPEEADFVNSQEAFYTVWTYKEAYVKYKGTGLSEGLGTFSVVDKHNQLVSKIGSLYLRAMLLPQDGMEADEKVFAAYCSAKPYGLHPKDWIRIFAGDKI